MREVELCRRLHEYPSLVARLEHLSHLLTSEQPNEIGVELRLDDDLQVVLEHARKVVLQVGAAVVVVDIHPVGRLLHLAEIRLELSGEHAQRRRLANAVRAEQPQDVARARRRQPVELERVDAVLVRRVRLQVVRQVDDLHRVARAVLGAVQAREARRLEDDALVLGDLDALGAAHAGVLFEVPAGRNGRALSKRWE